MSQFAVYESQSTLAVDTDYYSQSYTDFDFQQPTPYEHHAAQPAYMAGMRAAGYYAQQYDMPVAVDRYMQERVDTYPFRPDMSYDSAHFLRPAPMNEVAYHHPDPRVTSPEASVHIYTDREDSDSISSGTRAYSVGACDDHHSPRISQPYYGTLKGRPHWNTAGEMPSLPVSSPHVTQVGSHFVNPSQVEHIPTPQEHALSELDAEGEEDPDASPAEQVIPFRSTERTPELENGVTGPSSEDEAMSDPNDADFNPSGKRRRRSTGHRRTATSPTTTTTRAGRHVRKPSSVSNMSIEAPEQQGGRVNKAKSSKRSRTPTSATPSRPFYCPLMPYGCAATFPSKNEWKRHVSTQHVKLGYWRCELCPPTEGNGTTAGSYNDFNRKDLFTQHLKRMHADALANNPMYTSLIAARRDGDDEIAMVEAIDRNDDQYSIAVCVLDALVHRCFMVIRALPTRCRCPLCDASEFCGEGAWDERMEHLASHFERNKRQSAAKALPLDSWKEDRELSEWLLQEGLVERATGGRWRIGDGKPKRDV